MVLEINCQINVDAASCAAHGVLDLVVREWDEVTIRELARQANFVAPKLTDSTLEMRWVFSLPESC